jgi:hypothetical protein
METWHDLFDVITEAGQYDSADTMVMGYPYWVLRVNVVNQEIFAALKHFYEEIRVVKIPQRSHEPRRRLLIIMRLTEGELFFLENVGYTPDGEMILRASVENLSIYV